MYMLQSICPNVHYMVETVRIRIPTTAYQFSLEYLHLVTPLALNVESLKQFSEVLKLPLYMLNIWMDTTQWRFDRFTLVL